MAKEIIDRLKKLRTFMRDNKIHAFIVPSTDPHSGEYIAEHWECRKWISGFTGSAGTVVVTLTNAALWTDSRYFIQAEEQLEDTSIALFKENTPGTPSISEWLISVLERGDVVGIDPWTNNISEVENLKESLQEKQITLLSTVDPFNYIWPDRPPIPDNKIFEHDITFAGTPSSKKIAKIREYINENNRDALLISALDEICWTLNLRGNDIHCNPVFISYLLIEKNKISLYIIQRKIEKELKDKLIDSGITIRPYDKIAADLSAMAMRKQKIEVSPNINFGVFKVLKKYWTISPSPVLLMKAVKNDAEIRGFHFAMIRDGMAMVRFLRWIKIAVNAGKQTELSITEKLHSFRSKHDKFIGESFDTIAAYKENAAIVHYEADEKSNKELFPKGMLLLDSGGQYLDGTTDITRTIILGELTKEERTDYTLVLKGMINLSQVEFPKGTCGTQLDAFARMPMWKHGINYLHGTGHGVGHFLNVHEGPHQFRMNYMPTPLVPGMTITNEPGIYKEGRHGVRIENTMLVVKANETEFGEFYKLKPLTLCPIDKEGIDINMLDDNELAYLNWYHSMVYEELYLFLSDDERVWLKEATSKITK